MSKLNSRYRECSNSSVRFEKFECFMCKLIVLFVVFVSTNSFKSNQDLHQLVFVRLQRSPLFYYFPFWHMSGTIQSKINTPVVYGGRWAGAILTLLSWILLLIRNLINKTKGLKSRRLRSEKSRLLGLEFTKAMQDTFITTIITIFISIFNCMMVFLFQRYQHILALKAHISEMRAEIEHWRSCSCLSLIISFYIT